MTAAKTFDNLGANFIFPVHESGITGRPHFQDSHKTGNRRAEVLLVKLVM
jgi:hypothetical protein